MQFVNNNGHRNSKPKFDLKNHLKGHVNEVQHQIANLDKATKIDSMLQEKFGIEPVTVVLYRLENERCRSMKVKTKTHLHSKKSLLINEPEMLNIEIKKYETPVDNKK